MPDTNFNPFDEVVQAPREELWWGLDWAARGFLVPGETISAAEWSKDCENGEEETPLIVIDDNTIEGDGTQTWVRLITPTIGVDYIITVLATSSEGEKYERTLRVRCRRK
jgi:hypothetical protein